jgi:hypothetical protein
MSASRFTSFLDHLAPLLATSLAVRTLIEYLIIGGAVLLVTATVMLWVLVFRKSRRRTRIYRRHHHKSTEPSAPEQLDESKTPGTPGARRRRLRRQRPRNPTLAETGGLPPVRGPQSPPSEFHY